MTTPQDSNEKLGWVEVALTIVMVITVIVVILALLGPVIVNLTVIPWITALLATISSFVVKNSLILGLIFIGMLITILLVYLSNRR